MGSGQPNVCNVESNGATTDEIGVSRDPKNPPFRKIAFFFLRETDFFVSALNGVFNLCQHFEISYSRYANKHYITGVYIAINDIYREVNLEMQISKVKFII